MCRYNILYYMKVNMDNKSHNVLYIMFMLENIHILTINCCHGLHDWYLQFKIKQNAMSFAK